MFRCLLVGLLMSAAVPLFVFAADEDDRFSGSKKSSANSL